MGLKKGQTNNRDGRPKGVPNKATSEIKEKVQKLIDSNIDSIENDIKNLEPKDRAVIFERYLQYAIPKQQSISVEAQINAEYEALERLLNNLSDEAIDKIAEKLIKLNNLNNKNHE